MPIVSSIGFTVMALVGQGMGISLIWRDENLTDTIRHFISFVTGQADQF